MGTAADHATPYGAEQALQVRAFFCVGPYIGQRIPDARSIAYVRIGERLNGTCACGRAHCSVDRLEADMLALADVPGEAADLQFWLCYWAWRIARDACDAACARRKALEVVS